MTDIPYQLDLAMQASLLGLFDDLLAGQLPGKSCFNGEDSALTREKASRWLLNQRPSEKPGFFGRFLKSGRG